MTLLETFEDIAANQLSSVVTVIYADMPKADNLINRLKTAEFPVLVIVPYKVSDHKSKSGLMKSKIPFDAFMLTRVTQPTVDFDHKHIEAVAIEPMRTLARAFIKKFNASDIIDKETNGVEDATYDPTYSSGDAQLHGVHITATLPVLEDIDKSCE